MNESAQSPREFRRDLQCQDLDRLLTGFFKSELPRAWPDAASATKAVPCDGTGFSRSRPATRYRVLLAASLALFLFGQVFLAGLFTGAGSNRSDRDAGELEATKRKPPVLFSTEPARHTRPSADSRPK